MTLWTWTSLAVAMTSVLLWSAPAAAQNRREMQMMADVRMLQEQSQQLQIALTTLTDAVKALNGRFDEQAATTRKGFADQAVRVDQFASDLRIVREGVSEASVRIGQLSQELEAVRLSIPQFPAPPPPGNDPTGSLPPGSTGEPGSASAQPSAPPLMAPAGPGMSPGRAFEMARADYYNGDWDLCISGFDLYLKQFAKSELAPEAQWYIGECQFAQKKWKDAIVAYDQVITNYPRSTAAPNAYYKRGMALVELSQPDRARESFETLLKNYPDSEAARLGKQNLDRLTKPRPRGHF